jgi:hypothetical protein
MFTLREELKMKTFYNKAMYIIFKLQGTGRGIGKNMQSETPRPELIISPY